MDEGQETKNQNSSVERPWTSLEGGSSSSVITFEYFGNVHGDKKLSSREKSVIKTIEKRIQESCRKCKNKLYSYKCLTYSKHPWYSAITQDGVGAVHGFLDARAKVDTLVATNYNTEAPRFSRFDIVLPTSGNEKQLKEFCESLGVAIPAIRKSPFGKNLSIRLLLTRYHDGFSYITPLNEIRKQLSSLTKLEKANVILVDVQDTHSRENAISHLQNSTCTEKDCLIAMVDVGLAISPNFLYTAHEFVESGRSAYFPIVWSEYDPELVQLELEYYSHQGMKLRDPYDYHRGVWANETFQTYAISGADGSRLMMDKNGPKLDAKDGIVAHLQRGGLNIVRLQEYGLTQIFNPQDPTKMSSEPRMGKYLKDLRNQNETAFRSIIGRNQYEGDVFLAVVTSRKSLESRVTAIRESWGQVDNLRPNIHVRYFVGNGTLSKSELLNQGGFDNDNELIVMQEVADDEYPPVRKNVNMLKTINRMVQKPDGSFRDAKIGYIMKVDDDSYVNFDGLLKFLAYHDNSSEAFQFWGERGIGRKKDREGIRSAGLRKPYCLGGPGYILSKQALEAAARGFDDCVNEISRSPHKEAVWHSDVVISICITNATDVGCFDNDEDYQRNRVFANNYFSYENFVHKDDLHRVVSMHPYKQRGQMIRQHNRFPKRIVADEASIDGKNTTSRLTSGPTPGPTPGPTRGPTSGHLVSQKDVVILSDEVFQNSERVQMPFDSKRYGNAWTLLVLPVLLIINRKRILRKVRRKAD